MKKNYKQLDTEQRYQIGVLLEAGKSKSEIALLIGVHKCTISRELQRNIGKRGQHAGEYVPRLAQNRTDARHQLKNKSVKFTDKLKEQAAGWLRKEQLSPELIAVEWECLGIQGVSLECIYQWIWDCKKSNRRENLPFKDLYRYLRHGRRRFKRGNYKQTRGTIKDRVSIEKRPKVVENRERLGDIEVDLMMGKDHNSALLVMTERTTLITTLDKLKGKDSKIVQELISDRVSRIGSSWIKTMTFDNGKEFAQHKKIADQHGVKTYFTRPYTSQDKGTVENRIGLIRRFLPKKTDLNLVSDKRVKEIEKLINNRRVRKFGYISPIEKLKSTWPVALIT
ncbi:IS30 family transposase [Winogradskyella sp. SM1960]|uniref:IS30 family transposase n=1 Tax=Winogradskyella sp. SM1960 TaxID=2865955 RepID=UPI001CD5EAF8|nr:IS30 family transposase [Winogradskyella sp. SM1960]